MEVTCPDFLYQPEFGNPFQYYWSRAIPPEPPVANPPLAQPRGDCKGATQSRRSEPLRSSTAVRCAHIDGRSGGMASILLVSSEQVFANSAGVR